MLLGAINAGWDDDRADEEEDVGESGHENEHEDGGQLAVMNGSSSQSEEARPWSMGSLAKDLE